MKHLLFGALAAAFGLFCCTFASLAENRFALVIGNQNYALSVGPLKNPFNDISLIEEALKSSGFEVTPIRDATRIETLRALDRFAKRIGDAGADAISFFYYSGHGVARPADHVNFLIPIDVRDMSDDDVWYTAVPLDLVLGTLAERAPDASHFVVFDACRNELHVPSKEKGPQSKAFAPMNGRNGQFIAFSTSPNESASDSGEAGGPYSVALASELRRAGQDHLSLFQNVRERVFEATRLKAPQRPWEVSGLLQRIFFSGVGRPTPEPSSDRSPAQVERCLRELDTEKLPLAEAITLIKRCRIQS